MSWYCAFYLICLFRLFFHWGFCEGLCWGVVRDAGHLVICLLGSPVARGAVSPWERRQRRDGEGGANLFISKNHVHTLTPSIKVSPFQPETHKYIFYEKNLFASQIRPRRLGGGVLGNIEGNIKMRWIFERQNKCLIRLDITWHVPKRNRF